MRESENAMDRSKESEKDLEIIFRSMKPSDVDAVAKIESRLFSMPWSHQAFEQSLQRDDSVYVVAVAARDDCGQGGDEAAGEVVGYCGLYLILDEGYINQVAVTEDCRRMGIGSRMLRYLLKKGAERGMTACSLEVRLSNEKAKGLYRKAGFADAGVRPGFYDAPKEDALIMWLTDIDGI